jgi:hypothetical protein
MFGVAPLLAYQVLILTAIIDGRLLFVYFRPRPEKSVDRAGAVGLNAPA